MIYVSLLISIKKSNRADSIYLKALSPSIQWWQCWNGWGYIWQIKRVIEPKIKPKICKQELSRARHSQSYMYIIWLWYTCMYFIFMHTDSLAFGGSGGGCSHLWKLELEWLSEKVVNLIWKNELNGWKTDREMNVNLNEPNPPYYLK